MFESVCISVFVSIDVCVHVWLCISAVIACVILKAIILVFGHVSQYGIIQTDAERVQISRLMAQI